MSKAQICGTKAVKQFPKIVRCCASNVTTWTLNVQVEEYIGKNWVGVKKAAFCSRFLVFNIDKLFFLCYYLLFFN